MPKPTIRRSFLRAVKVVLYSATALWFVPGPAQADTTTAINPQVTWGVWDGWGTSLCWWAQKFGSRNDLANVLFTTNISTLSANNGAVQLPGLGLSIAKKLMLSQSTLMILILSYCVWEMNPTTK